MDRGVWQATVHRAAKSWTGPGDWACMPLGNIVNYHKKYSPSDNKLKWVIYQGSQRVGTVLRSPKPQYEGSSHKLERPLLCSLRTCREGWGRSQISWDYWNKLKIIHKGTHIPHFITLLCTCIYRLLDKSHILSSYIMGTHNIKTYPVAKPFIKIRFICLLGKSIFINKICLI